MIEKLFDEFRQRKSEIEIDREKLNAMLGDMATNIVLYGAGSSGIAFLYYLRDIGINPLYFCDGNALKWGQKCEGLEIISPEEIVDKVGRQALVIVTINTDGKRYCKSFDEALQKGGHTGVHKRLHEAGCKNVIDYTYFRRCFFMFKGDRYNLPSCSDVDIMLEHEKEIIKAYYSLEDDMSKEVYYKIVKFRLLDDSIEIPTLNQEKQYFENDIYNHRQDACFVDCGAFNGISLKTFLKENNNQFERYYGFEPDSHNYSMLEKYIENLPEAISNKMEIYNVALSDKEGYESLYSLQGPGSFMADIGNVVVKTRKMDEVLNNKKVTYIKMNIEGSELQTLRGSEKIIKGQKPALAIAGYHKTWDLWEIPLLIKRYREDYRVYLRSYMNHISFVFYAN